MRKRKLYLLVFALVLLHFSSYGQKIALVLSGGGSRGAAHIGVIKALEENNIPIHYIAGTSIGAIVGGMYAAGFTVEEMEKVFASEDIQRWANGIESEEQRYFYKQKRAEPYWIRLKFDLKNKKLNYKLPTNIISPAEMDFKLIDFFAAPAYAANYNFDSLYIPFRCVAADIDSSKAYILKDGNLDKAIRASMTFPFVFKPININGKLLLDGGMYNNFPSDVALEAWNPDVIIGSQVAGNYDKPDPNDIISQLRNLLMNNTNYNVLIENGVLIKPTSTRIPLTDFTNSVAFIDSGYLATTRLISKIDSLVIDYDSEQARKERRDLFLQKVPELTIDSLVVTNVKPKKARHMEKIIMQKAPNGTIRELKKEYFNLHADQHINYIMPSQIYDSVSKKSILTFHIEENPEFQFKIGGNISSNMVNEAYLAIDYITSGKIKNTAAISGYIGQYFSSLLLKNSIEIYKKRSLTLNTSLLFSRTNYLKSDAFFYDSDSPNFLEQNDNYTNINIQTPISRNGISEIGVYVSEFSSYYFQNNSFSKIDTTDKTAYTFFRPYLNIEINTLNRAQYANRGKRVFLGINGFIGVENYYPGSTSWNNAQPLKLEHDWLEANFQIDAYFELHKNFSLGFNIEATYSNQPFFNNYTSSLLISPAYKPTPTSSTYFLPEYRAHSFLAGGLRLIYTPINNLDLRIESYLFQPYQSIVKKDNYFPTYSPIFSHYSLLGDVTLVYNTFFGPISLGINYFDREEKPFLVVFNLGFLIFPPSSH